jgi:hypothetical protein
MSGKAQVVWVVIILLMAISAIGLGPIIFATVGIGVGGWIMFQHIRLSMLPPPSSEEEEEKENNC